MRQEKFLPGRNYKTICGGVVMVVNTFYYSPQVDRPVVILLEGNEIYLTAKGKFHNSDHSPFIKPEDLVK